MDITISGRHVAVTDGMREHARQKAEKLERLSQHLMHVRVTLTIEGDRHEAEVIASVRKRAELVAKAESHDMYLSIDEAVAKIEKQLHKTEERIRDKREATNRKIAEETTSNPEKEQEEAE